MLYLLSQKYTKEIALSFALLFFISGLSCLKAQYYSPLVFKVDFTHAYESNKHGVFESIDKLTDKKSDQGTSKNINLLSKKVESSTLQHIERINKNFSGGPSQPEMTGFKSVGADNMVSKFTGDFSYNIPLLDVGGYPVNMFYNSGISMDQESSWVGLGWNINPGTITRNMRGIPDDFNGETDKIKKTQSFRSDETYGLTVGANIRFFGFPALRAGASWGLSWNNKLGLAAEAGINAALSISLLSTDDKTYELSANAALNANASSRGGASLSPAIKLIEQTNISSSESYTSSIGVGYDYSSRMGLTSMHLNMNSRKNVTKDDEEYHSSSVDFSSTMSFAYPSILPSISKPFTRENYSLAFSAGSEITALNPHFNLHGYYSKTYLAPEDEYTEHPAYGILNLASGQNDKDAILDFNRANEGVYTPKNPTIAMPVYTYDVFSISGEGTGGSFRAYRGDIGHMNDSYVKSKEQSFGAGVDLGLGNIVHVGGNINYVHSKTEAGDWVYNNMARDAFSYHENEGSIQAVYFKNPGEKTLPDQIFQSNVDNENLIRLKLSGLHTPNPMLLPKIMSYDANKNFLSEKVIDGDQLKKTRRDKRTQVISFLNAEEAERIGASKKIYSYNASGSNENHILFGIDCDRSNIDSFYRNHDDRSSINPITQPLVLGNEVEPFRHRNHISEIDILGSDGKKYIYGLPVYNKKQIDVSFSVSNTQKQSDAKAIYSPDDITDNQKGRDWIMEKEEIPAYTHSYLLTELVSPNYVDVTGNGITEDDMGDAVKFNYSKYSDYKWRTPIGRLGENFTANYSDGLKTDEKDDKAHYVYGEREAWYLYSIESKNMVARFYVKSDRKDGKAVMDENGALDLNSATSMKRLYKISLFTKGELTKNGDNSKPVKTIQFFQSYKLCKNMSPANEISSNIEYGEGKLTLDSIWITYNGNDSKPKSRYVFYYPTTTNNPAYSFTSSDRWGTYKPKTDNPQNGSEYLINECFPYSIQDKAKADQNAAAWTMNKILLPTGAVINIDYESDSYAYVQNRRAANMFSILGFGPTETLPDVTERTKLYNNAGEENYYLYVKLPFPISTTGGIGKNEFAARYLADVKQIYMRLYVTMPMGPGLSGIAGDELVPVYADIDNGQYGLINSTTAWIKVKGLDNGHSPMVQGALQFLMQQLPGKAYKGYDLSDASGKEAVIRALAGMLKSIGAMFNGEVRTLKNDLKCQNVVLGKSFVKLSNPTENKLGGGLRVRRIIINDKWDKMTIQSKATYGQEYKYVTTDIINGVQVEVSSGVASWEPTIGGDENPHREIMRFMDHNRGGPYDYGAVVMPLGEMFYPSPMVGYSKVEVLSIHRDTVKNLPTREVTEFYTNKDFPYKSSCTQLTGDANVSYAPPHIMQLLKIDMMKGIAESQGFLVETNDMNGKLKSTSTFTATNPLSPVSYTRNYYNTEDATDKTLKFRHNFQVINKADGLVTNAVLGRDIEVMADFREHHTETITANLSISGDGFVIGFFPLAITNILQPIVREGTMYHSAALLKVVTHYGILDSVVVIDKGSMVSTKNLVYDAETGNVLLTRTQNEHNRSLYQFNYPAHWAYSGMGPAYKNIDATYRNLNFAHGVLRNNPPSEIFKSLESGDELYVVSKAAENDTLTMQVPCDNPSDYTIANMPWATLKKNAANRIWAVNTGKPETSDGTWVFMDADGLPYNAKDASIRIVRSGRRNLLDQTIGTITSLYNPVKDGQLAFNDNTGILQTSAATFKENWRVDDNFYKVEELEDSFEYARVKRADIMPNNFISLYLFEKGGANGERRYETSTPDFLELFQYTLKKKHYHSINERKVGLLLYNLPNQNGIFYKATLSLYSHTNSIYTYVNANHPNRHYSNISDYTQNYINPYLLGEISGMKGQWLTGAAPKTWTEQYVSTDANVSSGKGVIPYTAGIPSNFDNHENRLNISLAYLTSLSSPLHLQNKFGIRLNLNDLQVGRPRPDGIRNRMRCFWSIKTTYQHVPWPNPELFYYYYNWGNVDEQINWDNDPTVNLLLKNFIEKVTAKYCKSKFTRKAMNPYVEGVLGNWRMDKSYVYFNDRKENHVSGVLDTRIAGSIINYMPFWFFSLTVPGQGSPDEAVYLSRNENANTQWVWNNEITQYNRKGYEIENKDPLGRYNAGLYGYNQQLPIAVANNSRVREILFDGFEDYDYTTSSNCINCKPHKFFNFTTSVNDKLDQTQKHSGQKSLKLNAGESAIIEAPITDLIEADRPYGLHVVGSTTSYTNTQLGQGHDGQGLKASWYNYALPVTPQQHHRLTLEPQESSVFPQSALIYTSPASNPQIPNSQYGPPVPGVGVSQEYFSVKWEGKLQAPQTGTYRFRMFGDNGFRLKINGVQLTPNNNWIGNPLVIFQPFAGGNLNASYEISMVVGQVYPIEISFYNQWGPYEFSFKWQYKPPGATAYYMQPEKVPVKHLYPPTATQFNPVFTSSQTCYRLDGSQVSGNALTDTFSLLQNKKMLLSAWVKVGVATCCFPSTYDNNTNSITIKYKHADGSVVSAGSPIKPQGPIIEGWQRYEAVFEVESSAKNIIISLNNTSGSSMVFFDDLRVHPFNANLKSFVYDSKTLRLMAELDENNYASFYEYDDDGTLSRVKKETQLGIKTITETRSSTQKVIMNDD